MTEGKARLFQERMRLAGHTGLAKDDFARMYWEFCCGGHGLADWEAIAAAPEEDLPDLAVLRERFSVKDAPWSGLAWIVLNGGLGTTMKMEKAKSLLKIREGGSFLDLLCRFVIDLRRRTGAKVPLLFMNSPATRADTLAAIAPYDMTVPGVAQDFMQHQYPKVALADGGPLGDPADPAAWAPPGHGDFYLAVYESGVLDELLSSGIRWAFVSNADNLGASPDPSLLSWLAAEGVEFALEVTHKTAADVKGGVLVREGGRLRLLELAQVPPDHLDDFQDVGKFPAFNTNNLWLDLKAVKRVMEEGTLRLPLIVNRKTVNGVEAAQLETAIGAGVSAFGRASGVLVPRSRFAPVKTVDDLVVRRSDCYREGAESPLEPSPQRDSSLGVVKISLDRRYFESPADLELRIPKPLGLLEARSLTVRGDVRFGANVRVRGDAVVVNESTAPLIVADGSQLGDAP